MEDVCNGGAQGATAAILAWRLGTVELYVRIRVKNYIANNTSGDLVAGHRGPDRDNRSLRVRNSR